MACAQKQAEKDGIEHEQQGNNKLQRVLLFCFELNNVIHCYTCNKSTNPKQQRNSKLTTKQGAWRGCKVRCCADVSSFCSHQAMPYAQETCRKQRNKPDQQSTVAAKSIVVLL